MRGAFQVCAVLALSVLCAAATCAQPPTVDFTMTHRDPEAGTDLALRDGLNLRLAYKSTVPVRFQMEGRTQGKAVRAGAMFNVAPLYPAPRRLQGRSVWRSSHHSHPMPAQSSAVKPTKPQANASNTSMRRSFALLCRRTDRTARTPCS
jgi:hypothetical protein